MQDLTVSIPAANKEQADIPPHLALETRMTERFAELTSVYPFQARLEREARFSSAYAAAAIKEYIRYMCLLALHPREAFTPCAAVARVHRLHVIYTREYQAFCDEFFGGKPPCDAFGHKQETPPLGLKAYFPKMNDQIWSRRDTPLLTLPSKYTESLEQRKARFNTRVNAYSFLYGGVSVTGAIFMSVYGEMFAVVMWALAVLGLISGRHKIKAYCTAVGPVRPVHAPVPFVEPLDVRWRMVRDAPSFAELTREDSLFLRHLMHQYAWSLAYAKQACDEYLKFVYLMISSGGKALTPRAVWMKCGICTLPARKTTPHFAGR